MKFQFYYIDWWLSITQARENLHRLRRQLKSQPREDQIDSRALSNLEYFENASWMIYTLSCCFWQWRLWKKKKSVTTTTEMTEMQLLKCSSKVKKLDPKYTSHFKVYSSQFKTPGSSYSLLLRGLFVQSGHLQIFLFCLCKMKYSMNILK